MAYPAATRAHAVEMYGRLRSTERVAEELDVSTWAVRCWLLAAGVPLGKHGGRRSGAGRKASA